MGARGDWRQGRRHQMRRYRRMAPPLNTSGPLPVLAEDEDRHSSGSAAAWSLSSPSDRSSVRRPAECAELVTMVAVATSRRYSRDFRR